MCATYIHNIAYLVALKARPLLMSSLYKKICIPLMIQKVDSRIPGMLLLFPQFIFIFFLLSPPKSQRTFDIKTFVEY